MNVLTCASTDNRIKRSQIFWDKHYEVVRKLQVRIIKAQQEGRFGKVKALQWLLTHSFSAKMLAVKRVTENKGKNMLGKRLDKFGLELAKEKTGMVVFSRFKKHLNTKFSFLGFDFRWVESRNKNDYISMETNPKRMTKSLKEFKRWCKENRDKRIRTIVESVNKKLKGYFNYYAIEGNSQRISQFYFIAMGILYKWLNRRSQRKSFNFAEFKQKMEHYGLIKPKIQKSKYKQLSIEDYSFV